MNTLRITYGSIEIIILSAAVFSISIIAAVRKILANISSEKHANQAVLRLPSGKDKKGRILFPSHRDFYSSPVVIRRKAQNTKTCFDTTGKNRTNTF